MFFIFWGGGSQHPPPYEALRRHIGPILINALRRTLMCWLTSSSKLALNSSKRSRTGTLPEMAAQWTAALPSDLAFTCTYMQINVRPFLIELCRQHWNPIMFPVWCGTSVTTSLSRVKASKFSLSLLVWTRQFFWTDHVRVSSCFSPHPLTHFPSSPAGK